MKCKRYGCPNEEVVRGSTRMGYCSRECAPLSGLLGKLPPNEGNRSRSIYAAMAAEPEPTRRPEFEVLGTQLVKKYESTNQQQGEVKMEEAEEFVSAKELAGAIGVHPITLGKWVKQGIVTGQVLEGGTRLKFNIEKARAQLAAAGKIGDGAAAQAPAEEEAEAAAEEATPPPAACQETRAGALQ